MKKFFILLLLGLLSVSSFSYGDMQMNQHLSSASQAYMKAMDKMHQPMMEGIREANPDVAFVKGMMAHHQGAIDMAKIELKYGKDPALKKLAEKIIHDQNSEIRFMKNWLKKNK